MIEFLQVLKTEDANVEVTNAFAFTMDTAYAVISANSEDEDLAGAVLVEIDLREERLSYRILHDLNVRALDYLAQGPDRHYVLAMGSYLHEWVSGDFKYYDYPEALYLPYLADIDGKNLVLFGDEGRIFKFLDGTYERMSVPTAENLHAAHFLSQNEGYVAGDFGAYLQWNGQESIPLNLNMSAFIKGMHSKTDGTVMLACDDGVGLLVSENEVLDLTTPGSDLLCVTEFKGVEYWGDDDFGVLTREGTELVPKFETGYAFRLNASDNVLTINAGYDIYLFDGNNWIRIEIGEDEDNLISRAELDFTPV